MPDTQLIEKPVGDLTTNEDVSKLRQAEWYRHFAEELRAQIVETEFGLRSDYIKLYHSIGQQIVEKVGDFKREKIYGQYIAESVAQDIGKSKSSIEKAIQFYKMYPDLNTLLAKEGKDISWYKITQKYLPKSSEKVTPLPQQKVEEVGGGMPPIISTKWNEKASLWDIIVQDKDMMKLNLILFKHQIDNFYEKLGEEKL